MPSKYRTINGKKCEADLIALGVKLTKDVELNKEGARSIWENALDGNKVTEAERNAIKHIMKTSPHGLHSDARAFFEYWLKEKTVSEMRGGDLIVVDGVKCDEAMIKVANHYAKKGPIMGVRAAEGVWFSALDGKGVTNREKDTIDFIYRKYSFDNEAKKFLESKLSWLHVAAGAIAADEAVTAAGAGGGRGSSGTSSAPSPAPAPPAPNAIVLLRADAIGLELATLTPPASKEPSISSSSPAPPLPPPSTIVCANRVFTPGTSVRLHGLRTEANNGLSGKCEDFDAEKQRWVVRLVNGESKALKPENLMGPGRHVRLQGLANAAFNDMEGTVEEFNDDMQRWAVRLDNGEVKNIKPDNLEIQARGEKRHAEESDERPAKRAREGPKIRLEKLREIFDRCDIDKDGAVNKREMIKCCRQDLEVAQFFEVPTDIRQEGGRSQLESVFQDIDRDGDREIRWAELLAYYKHRVEASQRALTNH